MNFREPSFDGLRTNGAQGVVVEQGFPQAGKAKPL